jgi:polyhydroxyalkanoate synthesis regulator phasin
VQGSSERFKTDIASMPAMSEKLQQLRPVTFHYKTDPKGIRQYGLIAEEVQKVYPELVIHDDSGKIMGVHYEELAPLLLSELQKQQAAVKALSEQNALQAAAMHELERRQQRVDAQAEEISDLRRQVADLNEMRAMLNQLRAKDGFVARR